MTILFENEFEYTEDFNMEEIAYQVVEESLRYVDFKYDSQISLSLVDEETIQEINSQYRSIDKVTDVLSFPMIDYPEDLSYDFIEGDDSYIDFDTKEVVLGDIMICHPRMRQQALEYGHSNLREYAFLIAHSMLHLLGYDHMEDDERERMESMQNDILVKLNITRD